MSLIEILQNDGDVHVDHNHEVDNDKGDKVDDGNEWETTVSVGKVFVVWITIRRLRHQRVQNVIPAGRGHESGTNKQTSGVRTGRMSAAPIIDGTKKHRCHNSTRLYRVSPKNREVFRVHFERLVNTLSTNPHLS